MIEAVRLCRHAPDREPYAAVVHGRQLFRRHNERLEDFLQRVEACRVATT